MAKVALIVMLVVAALIAAGVGVLAVWDIPAPTQPIDRVLPDAHFPR